MIGITAGLTSCLSSLLVIIGTSFDVSNRTKVDPIHVEFWPFCSAFGLAAFAYSGQSVFPTLQHDMKHPENFKRSVVIGYISKCSDLVPYYFITGPSHENLMPIVSTVIEICVHPS